MARFITGITGSYTGKVGNVVGSSWRGIDYIRSLPKKSVFGSFLTVKTMKFSSIPKNKHQ